MAGPRECLAEYDAKGRRVIPLDPARVLSLNPVLAKLSKWDEYESSGSPLAGEGLIIPCKTPLGLDVLEQAAFRHAFSADVLVSEQRAAGRAIALILDLSNHDCPYTRELPAGVAHAQLRSIAKEAPEPATVAAASRVLESHWAAHPGTHVAVHCSYGFNRTGFVLVAFLVENRGLSLADALSSFGAARPPGIKHASFVEELVRRYTPGADSDQGAEALGVAAALREAADAADAPAAPSPESAPSAMDSGSAVTVPESLPGGCLGVGHAGAPPLAVPRRSLGSLESGVSASPGAAASLALEEALAALSALRGAKVTRGEPGIPESGIRESGIRESGIRESVIRESVIRESVIPVSWPVAVPAPRPSRRLGGGGGTPPSALRQSLLAAGMAGTRECTHIHAQSLTLGESSSGQATPEGNSGPPSPFGGGRGAWASAAATALPTS